MNKRRIKMHKRLEFIENVCPDCPEDTVELLLERELVSKYYCDRCASVDLWYVFERNHPYTDRKRSNFDISIVSARKVFTDPYKCLMTTIVMHSVNDLMTKRPCDLGAWRVDLPPGSSGEHCQQSQHICYEDAYKFLKEFPPDLEEALNFSSGFIHSLIVKSAKEVGLCIPTSFVASV